MHSPARTGRYLLRPTEKFRASEAELLWRPTAKPLMLDWSVLRRLWVRWNAPWPGDGISGEQAQRWAAAKTDSHAELVKTAFAMMYSSARPRSVRVSQILTFLGINFGVGWRATLWCMMLRWEFDEWLYVFCQRDNRPWPEDWTDGEFDLDRVMERERLRTVEALLQIIPEAPYMPESVGWDTLSIRTGELAWRWQALVRWNFNAEDWRGFWRA